MSKRLTLEEFVLKAQESHKSSNGVPKYGYSLASYVNAHTKVKIVCPKHGVFNQRPYDHYRNKNGCPKCKGGLRLTTSEFKLRASTIHNNKYDYSFVKYKNNSVKTKIVCKKHGEFYQTPKEHLKGSRCPTCAGVKKLSTEKFKEKSKKVHRNKYDYRLAEYVGGRVKTKIICPKHGVFEQRPENHLQGYGCSKCSGSNNENEVLYLASKVFRLKFSKVRLPEMRGLELDAYNPYRKLAFEYQGEGHYLRYANEFGFLKRERVLAVRKRDQRKKRLCKKLGIKLVCIPCFEWYELKTEKEKRKHLKNYGNTERRLSEYI